MSTESSGEAPSLGMLLKKGLPPPSIKILSFISLAIVALGCVGFTLFFSQRYHDLQVDMLDKVFTRIIKERIDDLDEGVQRARNNVTRLRTAFDVLEFADREKAVAYLKQVMALNVSFHAWQYNTYFALEKDEARRLFGKDGYVLTVHKDRRPNPPPGELPGNCVAELFPDPFYQVDPKQNWYHAAKASRAPVETEVYFDEQYMREYMFTVGCGLYDEGRFKGMVGIDILLDEFLEPVASLSIGKTGGLLVVDYTTGMVLSTSHSESRARFMRVEKPLQVNLYDTAQSRQKWEPLLAHGGENDGMIGSNGLPYMVRVQKMRRLPWAVVAFQAEDELRQPLRMGVVQLAAGAILLLTLLGAVSYLLYTNLATPLQTLLQSMQTVNRTRVLRASAPIGGTVETRAIGEIFNQMLERLGDAAREREKFYVQIAEANRTLEARVEERTKELQARNDELKSALDKLHETQEHLVAREKLASLGELTAGIAHEIKNPLNFVINFADLSNELLGELRELVDKRLPEAGADVRDDLVDIIATLEKNAARINEHGKRADSIVKNMLLHSRGQAGDFAPCDINALVDEYVHLAFHGMRAADPSFNVALKVELDPAVGKVEVVPQDFGRALLNIVQNGLYAVNEARQRKDGSFRPVLEVRTKDRVDHVEITVRDNGPGIPAAVREKLFNPFFTTKPAGKGTGLGLSITHDIIVKLHRGDIRVETQEGEYTEFTLVLPRVNKGE